MIGELFLLNLILFASTIAQQTCFYSQINTFFEGYPAASPQRLGGYQFDFNWNTPQFPIINSSFAYIASKSENPGYLKYMANITMTNHVMGSIILNPINGSQIFSITLSIILLKSCFGVATMILNEIYSLQLTPTQISVNINTPFMFVGNSANYKASVFLSAFDGYADNGNSFLINLKLSSIILNSNQHTMYINTPSVGGSNWIDYMSFTYIVFDITSFLTTPRYQEYGNAYITLINSIGIDLDFSPSAESKCILGVKFYELRNNVIQNFSLSIINSSSYSLIYRFHRSIGDLIPSLLCFGFCKDGETSIDNICVACQPPSLTCANHSYALSCKPYYYLQFVGIGYQKCISCMPGCKTCIIYSQCLQCEPTNILTPMKTCRKCNINNHLAGEICSAVDGCSTAEVINNKSVCRFCLFQGNFLKNANNSKCSCKKGYQLKYSKCIDLCGDGVRIYNECDDGNTFDNDGCSSVCKQQKGYICTQNSTFSPSSCTFVDKIKFEVLSIIRVHLDNKVILVLKVNPIILNRFSANQLRYNFKSNISLSVNSISMDENLLTFQLQFSQDIEGQTSQLILLFNHSSILYQEVSINIEFVTKQNLQYLAKIKLAKIFKKIFMAIDILAIIILLGSLWVHKMIGLQTIMPFQIIYLTYLLNNNQTQIFSLFGYFAGTSLDFGYYFNRLSAVNSDYSSLILNSQNQSASFLITYTCTFSLFLISLIGKHLTNKSKKPFFKYQNIFFKFCSNRLCFPLCTWFLSPFLILSSIRILKDHQNDYLNFCSIFETISLSLTLFNEFRNSFNIKSSCIETINTQYHYIPCFILIILSLSLEFTISLLIKVKNIEAILLATCLFALIGFFYAWPYHEFLHNAGVLVGIAQVVYFLIWTIVRNSNTEYRAQENQFLGIFLYTALALASILLGLIRVIYQIIKKYNQFSKQKKQRRKNSQQQKKIQIDNYIEPGIQQAIDFQIRYATKDHHLKYLQNSRINCDSPIALDYFKSPKKDSNQLTKYLMWKLENVTK